MTDFITSSNAINNFQFQYIDQSQISMIASFTDGLQRLVLKYPSRDPSEGFFDGIEEYLKSETSMDKTQELKKFFESKRVTELTDDDITFVIAFRH